MGDDAKKKNGFSCFFGSNLKKTNFLMEKSNNQISINFNGKYKNDLILPLFCVNLVLFSH
jgi:hypothetical protein